MYGTNEQLRLESDRKVCRNQHTIYVVETTVTAESEELVIAAWGGWRGLEEQWECGGEEAARGTAGLRSASRPQRAAPLNLFLTRTVALTLFNAGKAKVKCIVSISIWWLQ